MPPDRYDPEADYYDFLGVPPTASQKDIQRAYRELAKQLHPDRNLGRQAWAHERFQQLNVVKDVLLDPARRTEYDRQRAAYLFSLFGEPQTPEEEWTQVGIANWQRPQTAPSGCLAYVFIVVGIAVMLAGVSLGVTFAIDVQHSPSLSAPLTLDQIVKMNNFPPVVSISTTNMDCASLNDIDSKTEGILPSEDRRTLAVVGFADVHTCASLEHATIVGSLQRLNGGMYDKLVSDGAFVRYPNATSFFYLCENCGGSDTTSSAGLTIFIALMGLFAIWLGVSKLRSVRKHREHKIVRT